MHNEEGSRETPRDKGERPGCPTRFVDSAGSWECHRATPGTPHVRDDSGRYCERCDAALYEERARKDAIRPPAPAQCLCPVGFCDCAPPASDAATAESDRIRGLAHEARRRDVIASQRDRELDRAPLARLTLDARDSFTEQVNLRVFGGLNTNTYVAQRVRDGLLPAFNNAIFDLTAEIQLEREYSDAVSSAATAYEMLTHDAMRALAEPNEKLRALALQQIRAEVEELRKRPAR